MAADGDIAAVAEEEASLEGAVAARTVDIDVAADAVGIEAVAEMVGADFSASFRS